MHEVISRDGTATWVTSRPNGGIVIQQGPACVRLSEAEVSRLLELLTQPIAGSVTRPPILRYPIGQRT